MKYFNFKLPTMAAILGLVALIGTAATSDRAEKQGETFWTFVGTNPTNPADYTEQGDPGDCEETALQLCGVLAPPGNDPSEPDLSDLQTDLNTDQSQINYNNDKIMAGPRTE